MPRQPNSEQQTERQWPDNVSPHDPTLLQLLLRVRDEKRSSSNMSGVWILWRLRMACRFMDCATDRNNLQIFSK